MQIYNKYKPTYSYIGTYSETTLYHYGNIVKYNNILYILRNIKRDTLEYFENSINHNPLDDNYWDRLDTINNNTKQLTVGELKQILKYIPNGHEVQFDKETITCNDIIINSDGLISYKINYKD